MRSIGWSVFLFFALVTQSIADVRVALVIANGNYTKAPLWNPLVDAEMVRASLSQIGFDVTVLPNASIEDMESGLSAFALKAQNADVALFYYAGHGFAVSDRGGPRNFLMGVNADVTSTSERSLRAHGMPLDDVISSISESAETTLVFIDACRNDPSLTRALGGRGRSAVPVDTNIGDNVFVGLSTRLGDMAEDGEKGLGSPFARAFASHIGEPGTRVDDAFTRVRLAVEKETKLGQRPDIGRYDLSAPLVLVEKGSVSSQQPAGLEGPANVEKDAYEAALSAGNCGALEAFVRHFPNSFYSELAKEQISLGCSQAPSAASIVPESENTNVALRQLRIGTEGAYPPFNNLTADGKLEGFDIDIANALCAEMKVTCEFVTEGWDGIIPALQAGKFDAIVASMAITQDREEKVDFTHKYYNTPSALVGPKDTTIADLTKEGLAGRTIGVVTSTTHHNYAEKTYTDSTLKGYPSSWESLIDLANGRLDAVQDDSIVLDVWLKSPDGACCKLLGQPTPQPVEIFGEGAGIAVREGETELRDKLNAAIDAVRASGKYKEINDRYFAFDNYGS